METPEPTDYRYYIIPMPIIYIIYLILFIIYNYLPTTLQ